MTQIKSLTIAGYQQLSGTFEFGPTITVVTGPNEAGKSTLHEALVHAMFGFSPADRKRTRGVVPKELRRPWSGAPFKAVLHIEDTDGRPLDVAWDFGDNRVTVHDGRSGEQLSALSEHLPQQRQDFSIGSQLLGVDREHFEQLSCLFQESLDPVRTSENLQETLRHAVESTEGDDRGVDGADEKLCALLRRIGVQAGRYSPVRDGALHRLHTEVEDLGRELSKAIEVSDELNGIAAEQAECERQLAELEGARVAAHQADLRRAAKEAAQLLERANSLVPASTADEGGPAVTLPAHLPGRLASARDALTNAEEELATAIEGLAEREHVVALDSQRDDAEQHVEALAEYATVETTDEAGTRAALEAFRATSAPSAPPAAPAERDPQLQRFRDRRAGAGGPSVAVAGGTSRRTAMLTAAAALAAAGVAGGVLVHPALYALVAVAAVLCVAALVSSPSTAIQDDDAFEGRALDDLQAAAAAEDRAWIEYDAARRAHEGLIEAARAQRDAARSRLQALLPEAPSDDAGLEAHAETFLQACAQHHAWAEARVRADQLAADLQQATEPDRREALARAQRDNAVAEVRRLLGSVDIDEDDLEHGYAAFETLVREQDEARQAAQDRAGAAGSLQELLAGRTLDQLSTAAAAADEALARHEQQHGVLDEAGDVDAATIAERRELALAEAAALKARREERERTVGDRADIELRLEAARSAIGEHELTRDAVRIARKELEAAAKAAHSQVAPHLNAALARGLPRITRGRYREARVDEALTIRVVAPETGEIVEIGRLSRGTQDQIALIERLELARLLDQSHGQAPLLLDDPFARTDAARLPLAAELLAEMAETRQVVLFTDARHVVEVMQAAVPELKVVRLPEPAVDAVATGAA